jgi:hypothetical protein
VGDCERECRSACSWLFYLGECTGGVRGLCAYTSTRTSFAISFSSRSDSASAYAVNSFNSYTVQFSTTQYSIAYRKCSRAQFKEKKRRHCTHSNLPYTTEHSIGWCTTMTAGKDKCCPGHTSVLEFPVSSQDTHVSATFPIDLHRTPTPQPPIVQTQESHYGILNTRHHSSVHYSPNVLCSGEWLVRLPVAP